MNRKPWRALRALRIVLACLVLWLPARSAAASLGPADTVVLIAGAGAANATAGAAVRGAPPRDAERDRAARHDGATRASEGAVDARFFAEKARRADRDETANRTVVERRYLHCCVFLR
jgi:hypothetical protein